MQFKTILTPKRDRYQIRAIRGGRGYYFDDFEYEVTDDLPVEGVGVHFGPDLGKCCPRKFWPDIEIGVRTGWEEAWCSGVRLCSVRFTMLFAKYHDVDTSSRGVQLRVAQAVASRVVEVAESVPPLRADWLTPDVIALARGIHADATLDGLPFLYDALLDAGCDDILVIDHLQTCPDHTPRCWVVEMILDQLGLR